MHHQFLCKTQNPTSECPLGYNQTNGNKNPIPCRERCHSHLAPLPSTPNSVIWIIQIQYCLTNTYFSESHWMGPSVGKLGMCLETMSSLLLHKLNAVKENWPVTFYCVKFGLSEKHTKFEKNLWQYKKEIHQQWYRCMKTIYFSKKCSFQIFFLQME